jgi:hypothetical protein
MQIYSAFNCVYTSFLECNSLLSMQIYVVDSLDRERIGRARAEFQVYSLFIILPSFSALRFFVPSLITCWTLISFSGYNQ